ncbi:TetR/AcrR family transcriptional regulator [Holzapfeliella sp. JNUCC 80]
MTQKVTRKKELKAQAISSVTLELFKTRDFADISMNEIAQKAGISKGSLFNYYKTKENIFMHLLLVGYQDFFNQLIIKIKQQNPKNKDQLKAFLIESTQDLIDNHLTLIKLNSLRGPVLENKASREQTIFERKKLYEIHEELAQLVQQIVPDISLNQANKLFIIQSSIISGLINLSDLDYFQTEPLTKSFADFKVNIYHDSIETFAAYLDSVLN